jgi:hypothetical protein
VAVPGHSRSKPHLARSYLPGWTLRLSLSEVLKVSDKHSQTIERMALFVTVWKISEVYRKLKGNLLKIWNYSGFDLA